MDRMPRKPFLVCGDLLNGVLYAGAGVYLLLFRFSYIGYLCFSLLLATLSAFDQLAYNSIYPKLIPAGMEQKGYAVSAMLYPIVRVIMMPVATALYERLGVGLLLILQGGLSLLAALVESCIRIHEEKRLEGRRYTPSLWWEDMKEVARYFKEEKGLRSLYAYMAVTNGVATGYSPILMAFFGGGIQHGDVLLLFRGGIRGTGNCGLAAIYGQDPGKAPLCDDLRGISDLRGDGYVPFVAALPADAGESGHLRLSGNKQCDHAPGSRAAVHPGASALQSQCVF